MRWVRCTVRAQEESRVARGGCVEQSHSVCFALQHGQAVIVWANTACKNGIAVVQQMVRCEGGAHKAVGCHHIVGGVFGGDVFEHNFEFRKITAQRNQLRLNEGGFAVKQIDVAAGHFTMHQQQHAHLLHRL